MWNLFGKKTNNLYIPFQYDTIYAGGVKTFMFNLKTYLDSVGYQYTTNSKKADHIFFPNFIFEKEVIEKVKNKGGSIIQRLDGVHHPSINDNKYASDDEKIKDIYQNYANFIVFQTDYNRKQCFEMYGPKDASQYEIIVNGVNKDLFFPGNKSLKLNKKIKFIATANFRKKIMIEPTVTALDNLAKKYDFEFIVIGNIANPEIEHFFQRPYIKQLGFIDFQKAAEELRNADIFIHSNINDNCPNSVLEAISTGMPVVGFESGSLPELLFFNTELLAHVGGEDYLFHQYKDVDYKAFQDKIELSIINFEQYKQNALDFAHLYDFKECGEKYIEVFDKTGGKN